MLYYLRDLLWDVSDSVAWLSETQPYYEIPGKVDRYDAEKCPIESLSTFKRPTSRELITKMKAGGSKSVLDIGCGAGAFYKIARESIPEIRYHGIDASRAQIERARGNYGDIFTLGDASELTSEYIKTFNAVHVYSVFAFMAVEKQLRLLKAIIESGALVHMELGATLPKVAYVPSGCFKNHGKIQANGSLLLTAVSFPYRTDVENIVKHPYKVTWEETIFSRPHSVNLSGRDGGAMYHGRRPRFLKRLRQMKMLTGLIQLGH